MIVFDVEMTLKHGSNLFCLLVICIASKNIKFNDTAGARVAGLLWLTRLFFKLSETEFESTSGHGSRKKQL